MAPMRPPTAQSPYLFDGVMAAVLVVLGGAEMAAEGETAVEAVVLGELAVVPVAVRRTAPIHAALGVASALLAGTLLTGSGPGTFSVFAALLLVMYAVGESGLILAAAGALGLLLLPVAINSDEPVSDLAFPAVIWTMAWLAGRAVGAHRRRTATLQAVTAHLERQREASARLAVLEERARLTSEVHDAVGHTVAMMLAQAEAAQGLLAQDPNRARAALGTVQSSGRDAIDQLRLTLRVLRSEPVDEQPDQGDVVPAVPQPRRWRAPVSAETALLSAVAALWIIEILWFPEPKDGSRAVSCALASLAVAGVALRRRAPLIAAAMVAGTAFADDWLGGVAYDGISIVVTVLVLLFALGAHPARARAVAGGAAVLCVVVADELTGHEGNAMDAPLVAILCALPWTAGWLVRRHREQAAQLAELARQLEQERDANARLAVLAERTHMARELHDTVAHGVSVMVVQAAAAEQTSHQDTTVAREAINAVTRTGRDTLANLQQLLGLFELDDQPAPHGSPPTLAEIDELIAQMRDAGLPITLRVEGTPRAIRPEVAGCAFRIVREALTNVLKHAGTPPTAVVVRYRPGTLDLSIDNEGPGVTEAPNRAGHGLVGMRERTALVGGELQTGPRAAGGYSVHARLPLDGGAR